VVSSLKDKDSLIAASAAQDPYAMAGKAVEIGYACRNGKKPAQELTLIPVDLITKDTRKCWIVLSLAGILLVTGTTQAAVVTVG
jgi:ABC-type sugar transport system substrate-binding protein